MQSNYNQINDWVNNYTEELFTWTMYRVSDTENAKDILQDTFLAVAKSIDKFNEKSNPKT